ncbi:cyclin-L2-like [Toxorhynchites rutilus septentrionalis]|uniref:cyclin-L2-like n=1 Tax=Toxorhynchites rutilus septentrionalis TaxID=329112 RepID=UPI0024792557|nr:cyclin-L2-like [Toxorhynchites rutilus septentrionalis]
MSATKTVTGTIMTSTETASTKATSQTTSSSGSQTQQQQQQQRSYGKIVLTLENCLLPDPKLELTPSQADGLDRETEVDLRILGCELIQTAGILLKLPQVAMATGQVLFQRFFYSKSFVRHSMEATAMSCVCLASKIEEAPRRIRDVINVFHHIKQVRGQKPLVPMILDQHYINLKSQVIKAERRVLKELGFCVHVKHPHKLIVMYLKYLELEKHHNMMQMAWNFMNDSFRTDVFVRYQPETIACACIYLTARKQNIALPNNPQWFLIFRVTEEDVLDVCYRIMALYKRAKPNAETLEDAVENLKKKYQEQKKKDRSETSTPPAVVTVDRNNGSHNAWGGFISRTLPVTASGTDNNGNNNNEKDSKKSHSKSRSRSPRSRSRSHSRSRTPSRSRSRSGTRSSRSKSRSRSRSASRSRSRSRSLATGRSPPHYNEKSGSRKTKKTRHRSRTPLKSLAGKKKTKHYSRSRSVTPDSPQKYKKSEKKYDRRRDDRDSRYNNGIERDRPSKGERDRDRDRSRDHNRDRARGYDREDYRSKDHRSSHGNGGDKRDKYSSSGSRHNNSDRHRSSKHGARDRDRRR